MAFARSLTLDHVVLRSNKGPLICSLDHHLKLACRILPFHRIVEGEANYVPKHYAKTYLKLPFSQSIRTKMISRGNHRDSLALHMYNYYEECMQWQQIHHHLHPLVLMIVMVPLPRVWIRVRLTTTLPERPGPSGDTRGPCAYSPTGWRTGRLGRMRILALMSSSVTSPSAPPGFTTAKGYTTLIFAFVVLLHCLLSHSVMPTRIRLCQKSVLRACSWFIHMYDSITSQSKRFCFRATRFRVSW